MAGTSSDLSKGILFRETFTVNSRDRDGKKLPTCNVNKEGCDGCKACKVPHFQQVSRYECTCDGPGMNLTIDIACKILPLEKDSSIVFALASTLYKDASDDSDSFDQSSGKPSHLDDFDYAMYGKVFKYVRESGTDSKTVSVYVSFGGLLMRLTGHQEDLKEVKPDMNLYCLIQKLE